MPGDSPGRNDALLRVRTFLSERGVPDRDIARAEADDVLDLLVADQLLLPAERLYNEDEVAARTGMPVEQARKFWRALGFPDPDPDDRVFTDFDVEALVTIKGILNLGFGDFDAALQLARVIGSSMARIAEAEVAPTLGGAPVAGVADTGDSVGMADLVVQIADHLLPVMGQLLEFSWRRHLQAAARRAMLLRSRGPGALPSLCVGFADMVGFTTLSQQLAEEELAVVVGRFEEIAHDTVTAGGGRLVKMIGDEAMFVTESPVAAARIALRLAEAYSADELLSDVRIGMAEGPVLAQDGDYYGPVVNLAHAVVGLADPASVLLSDDFRTALLRELHPAGGDSAAADADREFGFLAIRPRQLKDLGRVQLWVLHRPDAPVTAVEYRISRRWERVAEVLSDIEVLRARGERLLAGSAARQADGGDAEGSELEGSVNPPEGAAPQVDEPS